MKKIWVLCAALAVLLMLSSCGEKEESESISLQEANMQEICELATMECYYHNVAKVFEEDAEQFLWVHRDKNFWIEYDGIVKIGIDADRVRMEVEGDNVTITLPPAKVLECKVDENTLTKDSFIIAKDSVKITAEDQTYAYEKAQDEMRERVSGDRALLSEGTQRAKYLLEKYVDNIGECLGRNYNVTFRLAEEN